MQYNKTQYINKKYTNTTYTKPKYWQAQYTQKNYLSNYNDPTELNSLADALFNIKSWQSFLPKWFTYAFPGLASLMAVGKVTVDKGLKPVFKGNFKEAALNGLMNLSETLDIFANPIKGIFLEKGNPIKGFINGIGIGSEGRKNYDWDTGSIVLDMALETISDPLNWITFGGKAAISSGAKATAKSMLTELGENAFKTTTKSYIKQPVHQIAKVLKNVDKTYLEEAAERLIKKAPSMTIDEAKKQIIAKNKKQLTNILIKNLNNGADAERVAKYVANYNLDDMALEINERLFTIPREGLFKLKSGVTRTPIENAVSTVSKIDNTLMRSALMTTGAGIGILGYKIVGKPGLEYISNQILQSGLKQARVLPANSIDLKNIAKERSDYLSKGATFELFEGNLKLRTAAQFDRNVKHALDEDIVQFNKILTEYSKDPVKRAVTLERYLRNKYLIVPEEGSDIWATYLKYIEDASKIIDLSSIKTTLYKIQESFNTVNDVRNKTGLNDLFEYNSEELRKTLDILKNVEQSSERTTRLTKKGPRSAFKKLTDDSIVYSIKLNNTYTAYSLFQKLDSTAFFEDILVRRDKTIGALLSNFAEEGLQDNVTDAARILGNRAKNILRDTDAIYNYKQFFKDVSVIPTALNIADERALKSAFLEVIDKYRNTSIQIFQENFDKYFEDILSDVRVLVGKDTITADTKQRLEEVLLAYLRNQENAGAQQLFTVVPKTYLDDIQSFIRDIINAAPDESRIARDAQINLAQAEQVSNIKYFQDHYETGLTGKTISELGTEESEKRIKSILDILEDSYAITLKPGIIQGPTDDLTEILKRTQNDCIRVATELENIRLTNESFMQSLAYTQGIFDADTLSKAFGRDIRTMQDVFWSTGYKNVTPYAYYTVRDLKNFSEVFDYTDVAKQVPVDVASIQPMGKFVDDFISFRELCKTKYDDLYLSAQKERINRIYSLYLEYVQDSGIIYERDYLGHLKRYSNEDYISQFAQIRTLNKRFKELNIDFNAINPNGKSRLEIFLRKNKDKYGTLCKYLQTPGAMFIPKEMSTKRYIAESFKNVFTDTEIARMQDLDSINDIRARVNLTKDLDTISEYFAEDAGGRHLSKLYHKPAEALKDLENTFNTLNERIINLYDKDAETGLFNTLKQIEAIAIKENDIDQIKKIKVLTQELSEWLVDPDSFTEIKIKNFYNHVAIFKSEYATELQKLGTEFDIYAPYKKQLAYINTLKSRSDQRMKRIIQDLTHSDTDALRAELARRHHLVMYDLTDSTEIKDLRRLKARLEKEQVKDIHVIEKDKIAYIVLDSSTETYYTADSMLRYKASDKNITRAISSDVYLDNVEDADFLRISKRIQELTGSSLAGTDGSQMTAELLDTILDKLPPEVRDLLPQRADLLDDQNFLTDIYNGTLLGSDSFRRNYNQYATNIYNSLKAAAKHASGYTDMRLTYIQACLDPLYGIGNTKGVFSNFNDVELLQALQKHPEYRLAILHETKKGKIELMSIKPTNVQQIAYARKLNAQILPDEIFKDMYNNINKRLGSEPKLKVWQKILYAYKSGYLVNPGTIFRNAVDTELKTTQEIGLTGSVYYQARAAKEWHNYRKFSMLIAGDDGVITKAKIERFFEEQAVQHKKLDMTKEQYLWWTDFFKNGPITNITGEVAKKNKKILDDTLWKSYTNLTECILAPTDYIERINRIALYMHDVDYGFTKTEAWYHISKTHFDYAFKNKIEQLGEMVFPFITFAMRNLHYWVDYVTTHPEAMVLYRDILTPVFDFDGYTRDEIAYSRAVQTRILNGDVRILSTRKHDIYVRPGFSGLDALKIAIDPVQAIWEKLNAPMSAAIKLVLNQELPGTEVLPILGVVIQRGKKMIREQNPVPSFVTITEPRTYNKRNIKHKKASYFKANQKNNLNATTQNGRRPKMQNNAIYDGYATAGVEAYRIRSMPATQATVKNQLRLDINRLR